MYWPYKLSKFHVISSAFSDPKTPAREKRVVFSARATQARVIDAEMWSKIENEAYRALPSQVIAELQDIAILVPRDEQEFAAILDENERTVAKGQTLYTVIEPSAWCQLGCSYCGQVHTPNRLSAKNQDLLIERIRTRLKGGNYHTLRVGWFGGEPLVGLPIMRSLSTRLRQLAAERDCSFHADIVTNGVRLTPNVATELATDMNVRRIEVTMDGIAEYHDRRRHTKSGFGTFAKIFRNVVDLARRTDIEPALSIRCNTDQTNRAGVSPLLHALAEAGIAHRLARFYVAPLVNWGNDAGDRSVSTEEFAEWEIGWLEEMHRLRFKVHVLPRRDAGGCLALNRNAEIVDPFGTIYNCSEIPLVPVSTPTEARISLPVISAKFPVAALGSLAEGTDARRAPFRDFYDRVRSSEYPCSECEMFPACGGACPKQWADGRRPCPPFKFNMGQRLLLGYAMSRQANSVLGGRP